MDWGIGRYEQIALQLLPASEAALAGSNLRAGESVLDIGCGSGNASLLAAEQGARVTAVDPAQRLLDLAAGRARQRGLGISFLRGEAAALPLANSVTDLVLSVFGVNFADEPGAAVGEIARVCAPGARVILCSWVPRGALAELMGLRREALAALDRGAGAPPFAWHDRDALAALFAPLGFSLEIRVKHLELSAASAEAFLEAELGDHPLWIGARAALEPAGRMEAVYRRALEILEAGNEEPGAFRIRSPYALASARRS